MKPKDDFSHQIKRSGVGKVQNSEIVPNFFNDLIDEPVSPNSKFCRLPDDIFDPENVHHNFEPFFFEDLETQAL